MRPWEKQTQMTQANTIRPIQVGYIATLLLLMKCFKFALCKKINKEIVLYMCIWVEIQILNTLIMYVKSEISNN
jgi:hypothetical protein